MPNLILNFTSISRLSISRLFWPRCYKCKKVIQPKEMVRKAKGKFFHLPCFACECCKRQLCTGEMCGIRKGVIFCQLHFSDENFENPTTRNT